MLVHEFKKYVIKAGESWKVEDEVGRRFIDTFPFVKRMGDLKNIREYVPEKSGNPNFMKNIDLGQEDSSTLLDGDYPGVEQDNV